MAVPTDFSRSARYASVARGLNSNRLDAAAMSRGAFRGFLLLLLGTMVFPIAVREFPSLGPWWVTAVTISGFAVAALHQGKARSPVLQGIAAAVFADALTLPLLLLSPTAREPLPLLITAATAVGVGVLVGIGVIVARRQETVRRWLSTRGDARSHK